MKKIILLILLLIGLSPSITAADNGRLDIRNATAVKRGDRVVVSFEMLTGSYPSDYKTIVVPVMYSGDKSRTLRLRPATVAGKRREIYDRRTRQSVGGRWVIKKSTPSTLHYIEEIPYERWMQTVSLSVEQYVEGCCSSDALTPQVVAENILLHYTPTPHFRDKPYDYELTELEKYDLENPFLHPMEDYGKRYDILQKDRDKGTSKVIFKVGSSVIDQTLYDNEKVLKSVLRAFELIENDPNAVLKHIMLAGYASPEGALSLNTRLGQARAESVKRYLQSRMKEPRDHYFELYNGREDWAGLRDMVEKSHMAEKNQVLNIIDSYTMEQEVRKTRLQQLGHPYKYMLDTFYPPLRSGGYVQVYYEIDRTATIATAVTDEFGRTTWVDPDSPRNKSVTAINRAIALMLDNQYREAIAAMSVCKTDSRSWNLLGVCHMMLGEYDDAGEYLSKAAAEGDPYAPKNQEELSRLMRIGR